jgi:hypothetical protein
MNREGVEVARCTVERLMRRLGLRRVKRGKVVRMKISKISGSVTGLLAVAACGGGGGPGDSQIKTVLSGVALDGYLYEANVHLVRCFIGSPAGPAVAARYQLRRSPG